MDSPLSARLPFEVLDDIGDVDEPPLDAGILQRPIEQLPRRADKRMSGQVFFVARLLADEHHLRARGPFAKDRLRRMFPQVAIPAALCSGADLCERFGLI